MERKLPFTQEHEMFRKTFRDFVENELVPHYEEWEKNSIVARDAFKKMGDYGFLCNWVDEQYGGSGADFLYDMIIMEEIGHRSLMGFFSPLHSAVVAPYIASYANDEQKALWLPGCVSGEKILAVAMTEPGTGSDLAAIRTKAVKNGDYYILNGSKTFISNGILADLIVVAAKTDPTAGAKGISLFVVERDTPGFERGQSIPKIGLHAQDTCELFFNDCRVPVDNLLGKEGAGFTYLMQKLQQERIVTCQGSTCLAERALELTIQYVKERQAFGQPLSKFQNTQFVLAECASEVQIARTFTDALIADHMAHKDILQEVSMGKYWICETAHKVASRCLQLFGGYGYCSEYEISRIFTDTRIKSIFAGTSEVMKVIVSRGLGL
ncbi:acyl-CoA dehydrogenase family protein [Desulfosporosinus sp. BICA1-9]|uniref:acyl-CoA dehydrogenase family protein n=1 Tax=Desulfosporosinus sp. BICA1-9 TaxID=1531958 RepID=UPI00054BE714|nr:acyl-CoA dehydrogenase family protein [Desulfosporosinus sp. BICA1-9]KJS47379.1 MAG: acyl-CoA dehydrogenase [Peptococcaceae bacterium BRH_c23]KJS88521.1 MAG: acyl-CoA dehydrogenase [Desulfosporosinus sp. BICA1-9]HBW35156.1 acyl-CoA dehydrogenase [Desulfosporosinus sp.]